MEPWVPGFLTGLLALVGVIVAGFLQSRRERASADRATRTPAPPTTQEVWQRLDSTDRILRSALVLLGEVAEQVEKGHPFVLSRRHLLVLSSEGYLPPELEHLIE